jgi:uncharacterized protein (DUF1015 family)
MPRIRPFVGLLYDPDLAGRLDHVTAPPYDLIDALERDRLHALSPHNAVRLIRGRDRPGDERGSNRQTRAAATLTEWRRDGILVPTAPAIFLYEFQFHLGGVRRRVRGVVAEVELEPLGQGGVIPHERTMPGPLRDRTALLRAVRANLSCVHFVYNDRAGGPQQRNVDAGSGVRAAFESADALAPAAEAIDDDGTRHRLWIRTDADHICEGLSRVPLMIADGHHRYAAALAGREAMRRAAGPGPWDAVMGLLVDASTEDPPILPIHRVVKANGAGTGLPETHAGERVRDLEEVVRSLTDSPPSAGVVSLESGEPIHRILALDGPPPAVRALHDGPLRDIGHERLSYVSDAASAEQIVRSRRAAAAFFLPPTHIDAVRGAIDTDGALPEKSTYFWPKPRTGMVIRPFDA